MTLDWWTLGIQAVNVAVLIWLLGRFFWRPVAAIIAERRAVAERSLADAQRARAEAADALAAIEQTRAGFAAERESILAAAQKEAAEQKSHLMAQVAQEAASEQAALRLQMAKDKQAADRARIDEARELAVVIAKRLLARLDATATREAFLGWLVDELRRLPEPERRAMALPGTLLEAVSASPLDEVEEQRCRSRIEEALDAHPHLVFKSDPALIAGLELRGPHIVVSNSWRDDLNRIQTELRRGDRG